MMCICLIRESEKQEAHIRACVIIRQIISLLKNWPKGDFATKKCVCDWRTVWVWDCQRLGNM